MDKGYNDLQTRFYRLRTMIEDMRTNEQRLKGICRKYEERLISEQQRYKMLLDSTKHQLKMWVFEYLKHLTSPVFQRLSETFVVPTVNFSASDELDVIESRKDDEISRKDAELRLEKNRTASLNAQLQQKVTENTELVAICDQLMKWVK